MLLGHLGTRASGLSSREAARRSAQFGRNEISRTAQRSWVRELVRQLVHPLALLLWVAAALASASDNQTLAIAIVAVILLNAALAYMQELQAERATGRCVSCCHHTHASGETEQNLMCPQ